MTKYDVMYESILERLENGELTQEQAEILNDMAFEKFNNELFIDESVIDSVINNDITFEEASILLEAGEETGANEVYKQALKDACTDYDKILSQVKKDIKSKNFIKAKAGITMGKINLKRIKGLVEKTPSSLNDDMISQCDKIIVSGLKVELINDIIELIVFKEVNNIGKTGKIVSAVSALSSVAKYAAGEGLNAYKQNAIQKINKQLVGLNKLDSKIDKAIAKNKEK